MYIYRWLMKHPVIILALYFLVIVVILWSMTSSDDSAETKLVDTPKVESVDSADVDLSSALKIEPSKLTDALVGETSEVKNGKTAEVPKESSDPTKGNDDKTADSTTMSDDVKATDALNAQFDEMSAEELLLMAREAYWNNGLEESEQLYLKLIELNPGVIDYKGELGNVFWRQGTPKKAAELYAEISFPMIEAGDTDKVANMVGFIGFHFPEVATEIHNALEAKKQQ